MAKSVVINYKRHFALLGLAVALLALMRDLSFYGDARFLTNFAMIGALHATAVVLSLQLPTRRLPHRLAFVVITAALSVASTLAGAFLGRFLGGLAGALMLASFGGAATYWIFMRWFWLPRLPTHSLLVAAGICAITTVGSFYLAAAVGGFGGPTSEFRRGVADVMPTGSWWLAFSAVIWWFDKQTSARPA
jgi:hypothetical protein